MSQDVITASRIREKVVETLVRIEHLGLLDDDLGTVIFGQICEMAGRCCRLVATGEYDRALEVAKTVGRSVPHAFDLTPQREALEDALDEFIATLERPDVLRLH